MNGAQALLRTLVELGIDTCFANPGTSEMHAVAALDEVHDLHGVLTLFEGVATGAADGYGRMAGRPAVTLLHLGPGLANGIANLHNARRAHTPVINLVGDHATYHHRYDAPLESDIASLAAPVSGWYRSAARAEDLADDGADAVVASYGPPGQVATLVVPSDVFWSEAKARRCRPSPRPLARVAASRIQEIAAALQADDPAAILLGGKALRRSPLRAASRVAQATGAALLAETFPARLERGAGLPAPERVAYLPELASNQLAHFRNLILVDALAPVSFFAYPGIPSDLLPDGCRVFSLADGVDDAAGALDDLTEQLGATETKIAVAPTGRPAPPNGPLTPTAIAEAIGHALPEHAVVVDESNTGGLSAPSATAGCPPHDWLCLTGGAIGQGPPLSVGAAIAAPGRRVFCLQADGSAMYTFQALWTQAREGLDVTTVLYANRSYAILRFELGHVGAGEVGERSRPLLDLDHPELDWVSLAKGLGVPAWRVDTGEDLVAALERSIAQPGPVLIEARVPASLA